MFRFVALTTGFKYLQDRITHQVFADSDLPHGKDALTLNIRPLDPADLDELRAIARMAASEGYGFVERLISELEEDSTRLFLGVEADSRIVAIGGVTPDPYVEAEATGRIRHVYVKPEFRRRGVGRLLMRELEQRATPLYSVLRLRTDTPEGAAFYEALGYQAVDSNTATHVRRLTLAPTSSTAVARRTPSALDVATLSVLLPGLGQISQGRVLTGLIQFGTVAVYAAMMFALHTPRALWLALFWNLWSAVDAYRNQE